MKLELTQQLQQQQILAPQMVLSMDILLLTTQDLQQRIDKEFAENPALELIDPEVKESPDDVKQPQESTEAEPFSKVESYQADFGASDDYRFRKPRTGGRDDKFEALQNTEGKAPGLRDFLTQQLHLLSLREQVQDVGEEIINNLDGRGYLISPADDLYQSLADRFTLEDFFSVTVNS